MSQSEKNDVDLLLRALGRDARSGAFNSKAGEAAGLHLDADELNAFAENALPPATRTRYASHLADCNECRGLVTQLAQAAGVPRDRITEGSRRNFWGYLSAFFSPIVLRYAVPALVLVMVGTIGLIVFRQQPRPEQVAQRTYTEPLGDRPVSAPVAQNETSVEPRKTPAEVATAKSADVKTNQDKNQSSDSNDNPASAGATDSFAEGRRDKAAETADNAQPPAYAPEPKADTPAASRGNEAASPVAQSREREQREERDEQEKQRAEANPPKDISGRTVSGLPTLGRAARLPQKTEGVMAKEKKASAGVKSVAGREFRRDDDGWVDVAYDGRATVVIKRGSEQYRALIADEPQLRTIAESLGGTVIVLWKGRGYQFR